MTGFRLAFGGAQERFGIRPDLSCFGKIIGGGLPVGAFGGRADIMDHLAPLGPVYQAGTLSGNPLAMAAGIATLKILRDENPYPRMEELSNRLVAGLHKAAKDAGAKVVSGESESYYHDVDVPKGKQMTRAKVHELLLGADVFLNVPILKHHSSSRVTIGLKNSMGVVWDRGFWHQNDLHQCIADFGSYRKPDLTIVDAYYVMKQNGPRGVSLSDVLIMKSQILGTDPVAVDAAAAKLYGVNPRDIPHIAYAEQMGLGKTTLETMNIKRIIL